MPVMERHKTDYPGVWYIIGKSLTRKGKKEKIYYVSYYKDGKRIEEKAGRQHQDGSPAKAAQLRALKIEGKELSNEKKRQQIEEEKAKQEAVWTIKKLWESYKENKIIKGIKTDQNRFDLHINPIFGDKEPSEIAPLDVDRLRVKMAKNHKPATVKNTLELLRRILNYGIEKRLVAPMTFKVKIPKVDNIVTEDLSPEQVQALLKAIEEDIHPLAGAMMKWALFTGMRRGEMFALKWNRIDFERGFISIVNPKGGQDVKVPLNDEARSVLDSLPRESEFVFPGRGGKQRRDIHKAVNEIKKKAGLPKEFRALHGLRHVYASMLASSGQVDLYTLQKLLSHKSPQMTMRYSHLRDETLKKAAALAGKLVIKAIEKGAEIEPIKISG